MNKKQIASRAFIIYVVATTILIACSKNQSSTTPEKKAHPTVWQPEDPLLAHGRKLYMADCYRCHNTGLEGATKITDQAGWKLKSEKGLDTLVDHAINGFSGKIGEMPPRGGNKDLTDEDIHAIVSYILAASQRI